MVLNTQDDWLLQTQREIEQLEQRIFTLLQEHDGQCTLTQIWEDEQLLAQGTRISIWHAMYNLVDMNAIGSEYKQNDYYITLITEKDYAELVRPLPTH